MPLQCLPALLLLAALGHRLEATSTNEGRLLFRSSASTDDTFIFFFLILQKGQERERDRKLVFATYYADRKRRSDDVEDTDAWKEGNSDYMGETGLLGGRCDCANGWRCPAAL